MAAPTRSRETYLRERYQKLGIGAFMPRDAVELLLGYCMPPQKVFGVTQALFDSFGSIENILNADYRDLAAVPGMTEVAASLLAILPKLYQMYSSARSVNTRIVDSESACRFFAEQYRGVNVERFMIACLDDRFVPYNCITVGSGTTFGIDIEVSDMLDSVLKARCRVCVVAHNHPGGSCQPSAKDIESTRRLIKVFEGVGIQVADHIIVGRDGVRSIIDHGPEGYRDLLKRDFV